MRDDAAPGPSTLASAPQAPGRLGRDDARNFGGGTLKLFEEAKVGLVEETDVVDVVLEHRHALDPEAPGVAVPLFRIDAAVAQHLRVDHAAAAHLEPALAAGARADAARNVELEAWLGEWEEARAHAHLSLLAVERLDHVQERALHVSDGEALVDGETLDLAEVRHARRLGRVAAVAATWRDDVDGRLFYALHGADLHGRCMRPQQKIRGEVEGVPVFPRRVSGGDVQGLEVVPLGLDLRPELDLVAQRLEHRFDLALDLREHVGVPAPQGRSGKRDVDRLCLGDVGEMRILDRCATYLDRLVEPLLEAVGCSAVGSSLVWRHLLDVSQALREQPFPAEVLHSQRFEVGQVVRGLNVALGRFCERLQLAERVVGHAAFLRLISKRITAAAAATLSDSTRSFIGMETSSRSLREMPCASLPKTIMPAFSTGARSSGVPPDAAAP